MSFTHFGTTPRSPDPATTFASALDTGLQGAKNDVSCKCNSSSPAQNEIGCCETFAESTVDGTDQIMGSLHFAAPDPDTREFTFSTSER